MVNELKPKRSLFPEKTMGNDVINKNTENKKKKRRRSPAMLAAIVLTFLLIVLMITLALFTSVDEVTNVFDAGRVDIVLTESEWVPSKAKYVVPEQEIPKNPKITNNEKTNVYVFLEVTVPYITETEIENSTPNDNSQGSAILTSTNNTYNIPLYKFGTANYNNSTTPPTITSYTYYDNLSDLKDNQRINSGWTLVTKDGFTNPAVNETNKTLTYVYAHTITSGENTTTLQPLLPAHTTENALFDSIKVINFDETAKVDGTNTLQGTYKNINVKAYGIQANYLSDSTGEVGDNPYRVWKIIKP